MHLPEQSTINFFIALFALVFGVYHFFRNPQIKSDKIDALFKQHLEFLSLQFNEKFSGFDKQLVNLKDNHLHTINEDLKTLTKTVNDLAINVGKLETRIDERIPKKT